VFEWYCLVGGRDSKSSQLIEKQVDTISISCEFEEYQYHIRV